MRLRLVVAGILLGVALTTTTSAAVVYRDTAELTAQANQIVIGDVVAVDSYWNGEGIIKSRIEVAVSDYLLGSGNGTEVLTMSGGTVDDVTLHVSVLPVFEVGDHVLLFLNNNEIRLVESFQGAYLTDGTLIGRMAPACNRMIDSSVQPLDAFLADVEATLGTPLPEPKKYTGTFVLPAGQRYAFCGYDWAYQSNPMGESVKVNPNCSDSAAGSEAEQLQAITLGMDEWSGAGAAFTFTYGGESGQTAVSYNDTNLMYFDNSPPDGGGYIAANYIWASSGNITENDIVFNDQDYTWWDGDGSCSGMMDIQNIATHELGHSLCLADLYNGSDSDKTMYGYGDYCETYKRSLHTDDINGIIAIYGAGGGPDNDYCADALIVSDGTYYGNTDDATNDGSASCGSSSSTPDVWYRYDASGSGTLYVDTCASTDYDTVLSIHSGCPGTSSNELDCDDDGCSGTNKSSLSVSVSAGQSYYIRVSGWSGATGSFVLDVSGPSDQQAPTPNPLSFATTPHAVDESTIHMRATTAVDPTYPVQYEFDFVSGGAGGSDSNWQTSLDYYDTGLAANTAYTYRVRARDGADPPNVGSFSPTATGITDIEPPTTLSFGSVTASTMQLIADGTFTNLTLGQSGLYFDCTSTGGDGGINQWVQSTTDTATGLSPNSLYTFRAQVRNQDGETNGWTSDATATSGIETPTGVDFGPTSSSSIVVIAAGTLTNLDIGDSGTYFDSTTAGGDGGINQWVANGSSDVATGLTPNTEYTFRVRARNRDAVETSYSSTDSRITKADIPPAPTLNNPTSTTLDLNVERGSNPSYTDFAIQCTSTTDPNWNGEYVSSTGLPTGSAVWRTDGEWGIVTIQNLQPSTAYSFAVKAINLDGIETGLGDEATLSTGAPAIGACCFPDGSCTEGPAANCTGDYQGDGTSCSPNPCPIDCNGNGIDDDDDLAAGTSVDCNNNGIPDECDLDSGAADDCNFNGVPDSCELVPAAGLAGAYFNEMDFTGTLRGRIDATIDFDWGNGAPWLGFDDDTFSIYWSGLVHTPTGGVYTFFTNTDDGVQLWVDGQLIIDQWIDQSPTEHSGSISLDADTDYVIEMAYYENGGGAVAELRWQPPGMSKVIIPNSALVAGADCNANDVLDECDIASGTSIDANGNGIPDECEVPETGACCAPDGTCTLTTEGACGDTWLGAGTVCDPNPCPQDWCMGDLNCSGGAPDFTDIMYFVAALNGEAGWQDYYRTQGDGSDPECPWLLGDFSYPHNGVDFADILPFANSVGNPCDVYTP